MHGRTKTRHEPSCMVTEGVRKYYQNTWTETGDNTGGTWQLYCYFNFNRAEIHGRDGEKETKMTEKDFIDLL